MCIRDSDYIDAAGNCVGFRHNGLFLEFLNPAVLVHLDCAVTFHIRADWHVLAHHRDVGPVSYTHLLPVYRGSLPHTSVFRKQ